MSVAAEVVGFKPGLFSGQGLTAASEWAEKWPGYSTSELAPEVCPACAQKALDRMTETSGEPPLGPLGKQ